MDVGVNEAGEYQLACCVDDLGVRGRVEAGADARDGFAFGVDVAAHAGVRGDDVGVAN